MHYFIHSNLFLFGLLILIMLSWQSAFLSSLFFCCVILLASNRYLEKFLFYVWIISITMGSQSFTVEMAPQFMIKKKKKWLMIIIMKAIIITRWPTLYHATPGVSTFPVFFSRPYSVYSWEGKNITTRIKIWSVIRKQIHNIRWNSEKVS